MSTSLSHRVKVACICRVDKKCDEAHSAVFIASLFATVRWKIRALSVSRMRD